MVKDNSTAWKIFAVAVAVFVMMATPSLRRIVWWLLPLGSGWDDIVGVLALAVIFIVVWSRFSPIKNQRKKNKIEY